MKVHIALIPTMVLLQMLPSVAQNEERIAELEAQLAELKLEAEIATNRKTAREASFGASVAPLEGTISIDSSAEATIVAHQVIDRIAQKIAADMMTSVTKPNGAGEPVDVECERFKRIAILSGQPDGALKGAMEAHKVITKDLTALNANLATNKSNLNKSESTLNSLNGKSASLLPVLDGAQAALSLAALFRTDSEFKGVTMTANQAAFLATLANEIRVRSKGQTSIYTSLFSDQDDKVGETKTFYQLLQKCDISRLENDGASNSLKATLKKLNTRLANLEKQKAEFEVIIARKESTPEEVQKAKESLVNVEADIEAFETKFKEAIQQANDRLKEAEVLVKRATDYGENLKKGALLGITVEKLIQAEGFKQFIDPGAVVLFVNVNYMGGTNLGKRNLLWNSFRSSGGASVSYQLIGKNLDLLQSNTYYSYDGFYKVNDQKIGDVRGNIDLVQPKDTPFKKKRITGPRHR